jgi:hypothetical protein
MDDREPTARARELGLILEKAAAESRYSGTQLARWLGWSQAKVSRIFSGKRPPSLEDVVALAAICKVMGEDRQHALRLVKEVHELNWLQEYGDQLPIELRTLVDYERTASMITDFETSFIPGLLHTRAYGRALLDAAASIPSEAVDDHLAARMQRQNIFSLHNRPVCRFFIDEFALLRPGPGAEVMSEQLHHLLRMSVRPYIEIRLIPSTAGLLPARRAFRIMEFEELKPVVFLEDDTGVQFLQRPQTVRCYRRITAGLAAVALNEGQSKERIVRLAKELGAPREEHHDLAEEHILGGEQLR